MTGGAPCRSALPTRFATITSMRRRSTAARTSSRSSTVTRSVHPRSASDARTVSARSVTVASRRIAPASKREISIRSSTSRDSLAVSAPTVRAAWAASGGSWSASSSRTVATIVIAARGVRSSCDTSATNRRAFASWARNSASDAWSASAVSLNVRARSASSSWPRTATRLPRSPAASSRVARPSFRTGRRTVPAASSASSAASTTTGTVPVRTESSRAAVSSRSARRSVITKTSRPEVRRSPSAYVTGVPTTRYGSPRHWTRWNRAPSPDRTAARSSAVIRPSVSAYPSETAVRSWWRATTMRAPMPSETFAANRDNDRWSGGRSSPAPTAATRSRRSSTAAFWVRWRTAVRASR